MQRRRYLWIVLTLATLFLAAVIIAHFARSKPQQSISHDNTLQTSADLQTGQNKQPLQGVDTSAETPAATLLLDNIQEKWRRIDDASQDGWDTEAFTLRAERQLKRIGKFLTKGQKSVPEDLDALATDDFFCGLLLPKDLELVFQGPSIAVQRQRGAEESGAESRTYSGSAGLHEAIAELARSFQHAREIRTKFKTIMVRATESRVNTRHYLEISGRLENGTLEQHATWDAQWTNTPDAAPLLTSLGVVDFEQVHVQAPNGTLFADCTESLLEQNPSYRQQFLQGYEHWLLRMPHVRYFVSLSNPGLAVGDVNGDGLDDLYVCQEQGLPNRLFLQRQDGTAEDVSSEWGVDWLQDSRSALLLDLDNDGDQDLVVAYIGGLLIAENVAGKRFEVRTMLPTSEDLMSVSAADFDNDGDVDLYTTAYFPDHFIEHSHAGGLPTGVENFVYHDSNLGGTNILLRNDVADDRWDFLDVTEQVGLDMNNARFSFMGSWDDYDNDGDQDLYVANDYGRDNLYRNDGGHFVDVAEQAGAEDAASGMSVSWGDYDRDGWMDAYISNMWSSAGKRVSSQPQFKKNASPDVKRRLQRFARGNTLLHNDQNGGFRDQSANAGVEMGRWAWGSLFADINNDGWSDLLIGNGYITGDNSGGDL
ncbi:MAG TPA: VCBS repeat-containing protein [Pirellulales bacterium]|nr:VCBS repeat-containing protein [Pirellulales bacterium]